jgi:RimJ/RimL family protein N-acetyltransferase
VSRIDREEGRFFLKYVDDPRHCLFFQTFRNDDTNGGLRIQISFCRDTDEFAEMLADLSNSSMNLANTTSATLWAWNENQRIIDGLERRLATMWNRNINSRYSTIEYEFKRESFRRRSISPLEIRDYQDEYLEQYLCLLDGAMDFISPPPEHLRNRALYREKFLRLSADQSFESFWMNEELVGLYWRTGAHINLVAVSKRRQREGYGSKILSQAMDQVFENSESRCAYLFCADWNAKAIQFYENWGMRKNGHSCRLSIT